MSAGLPESYVPQNQATLAVYQQILNAPNDELPITEMNDQTTRTASVIWASIADVATRWRGNEKCRIPGQLSDREENWGLRAVSGVSQEQPVVREYLKGKSGKGLVAFDLGCGNGQTIPALLAAEWDVVAVDSSFAVLKILTLRFPNEYRSGRLKIMMDDINTFTYPKPADLVIATDVLSYSDPAQFRTTMTKIHDQFVKEGGDFLGTLFRLPTKPKSTEWINYLKETGAWFLPDRRMVEPLLADVGFTVKSCDYMMEGVQEGSEPLSVQFVAQKISTNSNNQPDQASGSNSNNQQSSSTT